MKQLFLFFLCILALNVQAQVPKYLTDLGYEVHNPKQVDLKEFKISFIAHEKTNDTYFITVSVKQSYIQKIRRSERIIELVINNQWIFISLVPVNHIFINERTINPVKGYYVFTLELKL